jgi:hypothetical protein
MKEYHLKEDDVVEQLRKRIVQPFLAQLKTEGQATLEGMIGKSLKAAQEAVAGALEREQKRYEAERDKKSNPPSQKEAAEEMAILMNLVASEAALKKLQEHSSLSK